MIIYILILTTMGGVGVEGACKASKIIWREKLFNRQKIHFSLHPGHTVKMQVWVAFHITSKTFFYFIFFQLLLEL